jgi:hypothetical protein
MLLHHRYCEIRRNPAWMRVVVALAAPEAYPELDGKVLSWRNIVFASHSSTELPYLRFGELVTNYCEWLKARGDAS